MRYYEMANDMSEESGWILGAIVDDAGSFVIDYEYMRGVVDESLGGLSIEVLDDSPPRDITFATLGAMIVSERARRVFDRIPSVSVQYIDVAVPGMDDRFWIANILTAVDCIDERMFRVERFKPGDLVRPDRIGQIKQIDTLWIDEERARGHDLFRLKDCLIPVIVSDDMRDAVIRGGLFGPKFAPMACRGWRGPP